MADPPVGIPSRPGVVIPAFILSLYNEDLKEGVGSHFGLLYPNGSHVYPIDLSGKTRVSEYPEMPKPESNGKLWCVATESGNKTQIAEAMSFVCRQDNRTCDPIRPGGECYNPDTLMNHASYAFSAYRSMIKAIGTDCFFNESIAHATLNDPSKSTFSLSYFLRVMNYINLPSINKFTNFVILNIEQFHVQVTDLVSFQASTYRLGLWRLSYYAL